MATTNDNQTQPIEATDEHENEFYCGICGWVHISEAATHGHPTTQEGK